MKKYLGVTTIETPHNNHCKGAIYEHEGKYYILSTKYMPYKPFIYNGKEYAEVTSIGTDKCIYWFTA